MEVRGDDLPEAAAAEVRESDGGGVVVGELAVVAVEVFSKGVGDDFVHVDGDDFTFGGLRGHAAGKLLGRTHLSDDEAIAKMGHPVLSVRCGGG